MTIIDDIAENKLEFDYETAAYELENIRGWFEGLTPIRKIRADQWADKNIFLTTENSNKPGQWNTDTTPYMREILECLSPTSPVQEVVWMKGVQIGATSVGLICMLCFVDTDPAPIMYVLPTVDIAKGFSKTRLQKIIDNSEALSKKIPSAKEKGGGNTIQEKEYPGGYIVLAGANSAATLRSRPIRVLILDETDAYVKNLDKEGSPIALAEERTATYEDNKKIFKLSTPTVAGGSVIESEFETTDQRYYHVPCPHCGTYQILEFHNLVWPDGKPREAKYQCKHCSTLIEERFKPKMFLAGQWIATKPENADPLRRGYHTASLYSAYGFMSWGTIAQKYIKAQKWLDKGDDNLMRTFTNTIIGQTYSEAGEKPDWKALLDRAGSHEFNMPPREAMMLTAGVDIQHDRIEVEVVAYGRDLVSWSMFRHVIYGNPSTSTKVWEELAEIRRSTLTREDGAIMPILMMCVDTGYLTNTVYKWVQSQKREGAENVVPVDGRPTAAYIFGKPFAAYKTKAGADVSEVKIFPVGTFKLKKEIYTFLNNQIKEDEEGNRIVPRGYCYFPAYEKAYFEGLTAEEEVTKWIRGYPKVEWHRKIRANEPLDLRCYARAALSIYGYDRFTEHDFLALEETYMIREVKKDKKVRRSEHW